MGKESEKEQIYVCIHVRKQQSEMDMEQQTGSKQEKEYIKAIYCHPAYLTQMQSIYKYYKYLTYMQSTS